MTTKERAHTLADRHKCTKSKSNALHSAMTQFRSLTVAHKEDERKKTGEPVMWTQRIRIFAEDDGVCVLKRIDSLIWSDIYGLSQSSLFFFPCAAAFLCFVLSLLSVVQSIWWAQRAATCTKSIEPLYVEWKQRLICEHTCALFCVTCFAAHRQMLNKESQQLSKLFFNAFSFSSAKQLFIRMKYALR